jgi:rhodanese-related sulfurtransferase
MAGQSVISADEARRLTEGGSLTLIDVRSPTEWRQTGVPEGALAITIHDARGEAGFVEAVLAAVGGDRDRPIAVICASGVRSHRAQQWLADNGFRNVADVREGMLGRGDDPGWLDRGLPVEPCATC